MASKSRFQGFCFCFGVLLGVFLHIEPEVRLLNYMIAPFLVFYCFP